MSAANLPKPRDPRCGRLASDLPGLDYYWAELKSEVDATEEDERQRRRVEFVRTSDGTYNSDNGHFYCDACYIAAGMPMGRCP